MGDAADRHLALGHDLEQRRLHLGRRAVDLVGQHEVGEDRAELDVEGVLAGLVDAGADDVGGHEVGRELQAGERAADRAGQRLDGERLRDAGHTLEQAVAAGEQATSIRSTIRSWPTMTRLISNSTRSRRAASAEGRDRGARSARPTCWQFSRAPWSWAVHVLPAGPEAVDGGGGASPLRPVSYRFMGRSRRHGRWPRPRRAADWS